MPTEPRALAKYEQAASVEYAQFDPIVSVIASEKVFKIRYGQQTNEALVTELRTKLETKLDGYEAILSKQKYLAGDVRRRNKCSNDRIILMGCLLVQELTLADLFHLPYGTIIFEDLQYGGLDKRPHLHR